MTEFTPCAGNNAATASVYGRMARQAKATTVAMVLSVAVAAAVAVVVTAGNADEVTSATTPTTTTAIARGSAGVDWQDNENAKTFAGGWSVRSTDGDAPLLQVDRDGRTVGILEAIAFPLDSLDHGADLDAMVAGYYESIATDRRTGCGYEIETVAPTRARVGGQDGIAYGFRGPGERTVAFATTTASHLVLVTAAAHDEGGCIAVEEETVFDTGTLDEFDDLFARIVADTPLPLDLVVGPPADS